MKNAFILSAVFALLFGLTTGCKNGGLTTSKEPQSKCPATLPALAASEDYSARGMKASNEGNYDCSLEDCEKAVELNAKNREALVCRGYARMKREEFDAAESDFAAAIDLSPNDPLVLHQRSRLYRRTKRFGAALADMNKVIELFPADFYYEFRAGIYAELKDYENALKDYAEAIRQKPETASYYAGRAEVYRQMGRAELAEADAKRFEELKKSEDEKKSAEPDVRQIAVLNDAAVSLPKPVFPLSARAVKAIGKVRVLISVNSRGNVVSARAISGHPLLRSAAERAAEQAKFKPSAIERGYLDFNFAAG